MKDEKITVYDSELELEYSKEEIIELTKLYKIYRELLNW